MAKSPQALALAAQPKRCFVVMPIKREGSAEHRHYKAIYENFLKPELGSLGFEVLRADEVQKSGAITKDIIVRLATADLVVADLTDLNPNVFYELGARHALRGVGTIMLLDESKTPDIPFDLSAYRVVKFSSDVVGIGSLRTQLVKFVEQLATDIEHVDNPIHDWLPWLPRNAVDRSVDDEDTRLRSDLADARSELKKYQKLYGDIAGVDDPLDDDPLAIISAAREEADTGNLPTVILEQARQATAQGDVALFLDAVQRSFKAKTFVLSPTQLIELTYLSERFGSSNITSAIYAFACQQHPTNSMIRDGQTMMLAHSERAQDRARARREISEKIGIQILGDRVVIPDNLPEFGMMYGMMLDAYSPDQLESEALRINEAALEKFPDISGFLRIQGKYLALRGSKAEALKYHRQSVLVDDADDVSFLWYGNELHNQERSVDAVEAYAAGAMREPDDSALFAHIADEIARAFAGFSGGESGKKRALPPDIGPEHAVFAIQCSFSCETGRGRAGEYIDRALKSLRMKAPEVPININAEELVPYQRRFEFASELYARLKSETTTVASC